MHTFSTLGVILMVVCALLFSLGTAIASVYWAASSARRSLKRVSAATNAEQAPPKWESRLRDLETELASLSSNFEKVTRQLMRLNSRAGMRELRERDQEAPRAPPPGASKAELRRFYGLTQDGPEFARRQLQLVPSKE